jgi:hypothetical protein
MLICIIAWVFIAKVVKPRTKKMQGSKIDLTMLLITIISVIFFGALWIFVSAIVSRFF